MLVAITGSSGLIGTALQERLIGEGHGVVAMHRGSSDDPHAVWNPADGWVREGALDGVDAVVNLGGASLEAGRWTESRREVLRRSRIDSTRVLVDHIARMDHRPVTLVNASAVGYYGEGGDAELTEESPKGEGFLADLVRDWEAEARRAEDAGLRVVMTRSGIVLSSEGGALKKMLLPFRLGVGGTIGSGRRWMSWISHADAVSALMHALTSDLSGPVNTCATPVTNREFTKAFGSALRRPTIFPVPPPALRLMFGQMADEMLLVSQRMVPKRLTESGFQHRHPDILDGMRAALDGSGREAA